MFKRLKQYWWFKAISNKYAISGLLFAVWMLFFDANSALMQSELNQEIKELKASIEFYSTELEFDREELHELQSNPAAFEKYAREKFWMHRKGEEIYVFEFVDD